MSRSASRLAVATVVLALILAWAAAPAAGQFSAESTVMHVALQPDGDAQWTLSAWVVLEDENETAAFRRLADEYVTGETDVLHADPYEQAASLASEETGREMTILDVGRAASQSNDTGELRLSFTWTNFSQVSDDRERLELGDVFATPSGTWLPRLNNDQLLVIEFPEGYVVESVSQPLDNRSIRVTGPTTFEPGEPSATLERGSDGVTSPTTPSPGIGAPLALTAGAALAILLVVAYLLYRRWQESGDETPEAGAVAEPAPESEALLSDEERVLRLLRAEGGRMKQVDIVEETDWSNAKVSQLLSSMSDEGQIEKLRIGRENLISLPDDGDE